MYNNHKNDNASESAIGIMVMRTFGIEEEIIKKGENKWLKSPYDKIEAYNPYKIGIGLYYNYLNFSEDLAISGSLGSCFGIDFTSRIWKRFYLTGSADIAGWQIITQTPIAISRKFYFSIGLYYRYENYYFDNRRSIGHPNIRFWPTDHMATTSYGFKTNFTFFAFDKHKQHMTISYLTVNLGYMPLVRKYSLIMGVSIGAY